MSKCINCEKTGAINGLCDTCMVKRIAELEAKNEKLTIQLRLSVDGSIVREESVSRDFAELEEENKSLDHETRRQANLILTETSTVTDLEAKLAEYARHVMEADSTIDELEAQLAEQKKVIDDCIKFLDDGEFPLPVRVCTELERKLLECVTNNDDMIAGLEAKLAEYGEWYDSLMTHCVKGYYKCEKCGGPVAEGLCCAWCNTTTPDLPEAEPDKTDMERIVEETKDTTFFC